MLFDNHGRQINYLRLAVTDRCNLRCYYCMPANGLDWVPRKELLTYEEILYTCTLLARMGISKIRITGGEPFVRKDLLKLLKQLVRIKGIEQVSITTNGVLTAPFIPQLKQLGITNINLSLDTLDADRLFLITRRDYHNKVMETFDELLKHEMNVKINTVVMAGKNTEDIIPLVNLTKELPIAVRFIEEMPFNGNGHIHSGIQWNFKKILNHIGSAYPAINKIQDPPSSTSMNYAIPGHKGTIGIIAAYSRSFCGTCNRIRITPEGVLKTCLYDNGVMNIKDLLRSGYERAEIEQKVLEALANRKANGWEAESTASIDSLYQSMAAIGG